MALRHVGVYNLHQLVGILHVADRFDDFCDGFIPETRILTERAHASCVLQVIRRGDEGIACVPEIDRNPGDDLGSNLRDSRSCLSGFRWTTDTELMSQQLATSHHTPST
jgi:hypothetical protein